MNFLYFLIIGLIAGWLAGQITKGRGFGLLGNLVIGVIGALVGGFLFIILGLKTTTIIGSLIAALVGAIILIWIIGYFKKSTK